MGRNPLAELIRRLALEATETGALEVVLAHRGVPGGERVVVTADIVRVGNAALVLGDGTEVPLHRVREVRHAGVVVWPTRA